MDVIKNKHEGKISVMSKVVTDFLYLPGFLLLYPQQTSNWRLLGHFWSKMSSKDPCQMQPPLRSRLTSHFKSKCWSLPAENGQHSKDPESRRTACCVKADLKAFAEHRKQERRSAIFSHPPHLSISLIYPHNQSGFRKSL